MRRRGAKFASAVCLLVTVVAAEGRAQPAPEQVARAVSRTVETLATAAQVAVRTFTDPLPSTGLGRDDQPPFTAMQRTRRALTAVGGVAGVGFLIAFVVLVSAQAQLETVARAAESDVSRSFWTGIAGQLFAVPILLSVSVVLALTIILIPAIPIAMLAWALAYAGALTLGLFAVAVVLGRAIVGRGGPHDRRKLLSGVVTGLLVLAAAWVAAALLVTVPVLGILVRVVALALTWVGATVGLGAVIRSRAGTRGALVEITAESAVPAWQTPTPVFGVAAARRPTPASTTISE